MKKLNSKTVFWIYLVVLITALGWKYIPNEPILEGFVIQTILAVVIFMYSLYLGKLERRAILIEILETLKNNK